MRHEVVEVDETEFCFKVRVFAQMATRVTVLCSEALLHAEHVPETGETRFEVQLRALRQERGLPVVVELEQRCAALNLRLHEAGRCYLDQALRGQRLAERAE